MESQKSITQLTEVELLELQTGIIQGIEKTDKNLQQNPSKNTLHFKGTCADTDTNEDISNTYPLSILNTGKYGNGCANSFSQPHISLKEDEDFLEAEAWELRSKVKEKDFVNQPPLFDFVFCDWLNIEGKSEDELRQLRSYGENENSFFKINEAANTRVDLFYLVINVRIVNMRHSVFIFVCKKEQWEKFLQENIKNPNERNKKGRLLEILKLCFKVKVKFWTIPTMGALKNPFMMNKTLESDCYNVEIFENRLEVYVDQNGMKLPMLLKPIWNLIIRMTAGITSNKQCFDVSFFLEAGDGDNHKFLFKYPERLLGVVRGDKMEWGCARSI